MDDALNGLLTVNGSDGNLHSSPPGAWLDQIATICEACRLDALRPQINTCAEALKDGDSVDVAVIGRFKAGKSSFLNSLIGRDILPVAAVPLTAVVTRLRYGPRDRAVVTHLDGQAQDIPVLRLAEYVTEQHNPDNVKAVAIVDVEVPNLEAYQGIRFVDTPGLGSVFAHNTQIAMDWLPRVGASLLAVSSDHPLSEQDVELLKGAGHRGIHRRPGTAGPGLHPGGVGHGRGRGRRGGRPAAGHRAGPGHAGRIGDGRRQDDMNASSFSIPVGIGSPIFRFTTQSKQGRAWDVGIGLLYSSGGNVQGLAAFIEDAEGNQQGIAEDSPWLRRRSSRRSSADASRRSSPRRGR